MQNFSVKSLNHLNQDLFVSPLESTSANTTRCFNIDARSEFQEIIQWKYWISGVSGAIFISFGCLGNFFTMMILKSPSLTSAFHSLLIWLCGIDSFFLVTNIITTIQALGYEPNGFLTTIMNIFGQICLSASVFMIISISLERRFAVCQPHVYRIHIKTTPLWKHLGLYLGPVLTAAVLLNLPYFLNAFTKLKKNQLYVKINLYLRAIHPLTTTGWMPVLLLIVLNICVVRGIANLNRTLPSQSLPNNANPWSRRKKRHRKEVKATYMALAIIVTFAVLNLPRIIASTIEVMNTNQIIHCVEQNYVPHKEFYLLDFIARICMILNSATNFLVYCAISTPFQVACKAYITSALQRLKSIFSIIAPNSNTTIHNFEMKPTNNASNVITNFAPDLSVGCNSPSNTGDSNSSRLPDEDLKNTVTTRL